MSSDTNLATDDINQLLDQVMNGLKPSQMKSVHTKLGKHIQRYNKQRIGAQRNVDGGAYTPRKIKKVISKKRTVFKYNGRYFKVYVLRETDKYILASFGDENYAYFSKDKMEDQKKAKRIKTGAMLLGFRKHIKVSANQDGAKIGYNALRGRAKRIGIEHHTGATVNVGGNQFVKYPVRELLGLSKRGKLDAIEIVMDYINEVME